MANNNLLETVRGIPVPPGADIVGDTAYYGIRLPDGCRAFVLLDTSGGADVDYHIPPMMLTPPDFTRFVAALKRAVDEYLEPRRAAERARQKDLARFYAETDPNLPVPGYRRPLVFEDGSDFGSRAWRNRD